MQARSPGGARVRVFFDTYSHRSDELRCFAQCLLHDRCIKYAQVKSFGDRQSAADWVCAWSLLGACWGNAN
eukprot:1217631-Alexandrium_andersonii.AAC.1